MFSECMRSAWSSETRKWLLMRCILYSLSTHLTFYLSWFFSFSSLAGHLYFCCLRNSLTLSLSSLILPRHLNRCEPSSGLRKAVSLGINGSLVSSFSSCLLQMQKGDVPLPTSPTASWEDSDEGVHDEIMCFVTSEVTEWPFVSVAFDVREPAPKEMAPRLRPGARVRGTLSPLPFITSTQIWGNH